MTNPHQPQPIAHLLLRPGQPVYLNHRASRLNATVTPLGSRTVGVRYQSTAVAVPLADAVGPLAVRPADGARLRAARQKILGDQIIFGAHIRTVAAPPGRRPRWMAHRDLHRLWPAALVIPGAVMRVVETPPVMVNGDPLATSSPAWAGTAVAEPITRRQLPLPRTATPAQPGLAPIDTAGRARRGQRVVLTSAHVTTTAQGHGV